MFRSLELQSIATQARQEIALVVTGLESAANAPIDDNGNLDTHVFAALGILRTNIQRLQTVEDALGECLCDCESQGLLAERVPCRE